MPTPTARRERLSSRLTRVLQGGTGVRGSVIWGLGAAILVLAGIVVGSRGGRDFDPALVAYAGASVFAAYGIAYRYSMWLQRPPTRVYWVRGLRFMMEPRHLGRNLLRLMGLFIDNFVLQRFIGRRSPLRWTAHWLIAWGCILAAMVTFPLSWGWIRFETARDSQEIYHAFLFGFRVLSFPLSSPAAPLIFNILNIAAVMVLAGVGLAMWRRATDAGALAVQTLANDFIPLMLLFAVSITGLLLTVSTHFLHGSHYGFLSQFHAATVILTLVYLPFGKFFHVFQRPAQFGVRFYKDEGARHPPALCARCGVGFASALQIEDLKQVQAALDIRYAGDEAHHYQDVCPACRRKSLALGHDTLWSRGKREANDG